MKNSLITYLLGFFFLITCTKAICGNHPKIDSVLCLEIEGKILNAAEGLDGVCKVELVCANNILDSVILKNGKKKFKFYLSKNNSYTIKLSKNGYVNKLISIDTKLSSEFDDLYRFSFDTKMTANMASEKLNKDLLDYPIAIIYFDAKKECFDYNKAYTSKIKKELAFN